MSAAFLLKLFLVSVLGWNFGYTLARGETGWAILFAVLLIFSLAVPA
jgi:uncharacterized membrane protein